MLITICEKVAVYALTAGLLGRFFTKELGNTELMSLAIVSALLVIGGYRIAKGVR